MNDNWHDVMYNIIAYTFFNLLMDYNTVKCISTYITFNIICSAYL